MAELYHASYRRLVAQVYAFTTDLGEAQEAVQEAFARALARRGGLAGVDVPEAWLRTVAVNIVKRRWRRKQLLDRILLRERPLTRVLQEAPEPDRADLREALASIPRTYREVIVLHYLADLPVDEVAAILEVPVGTVKSRLSRGREALKGLLDDVDVPPLSQVERRAGAIKTRRRVAQAAVMVLVLLVSGVALLPGRWQREGTTLAASPSPSVMTWSGSGLTLRSVPDVPTVPDIPGTIDRFNVDGQELLHTDAGIYARSADGGQTWEIVDYTPRQGGAWGGGLPLSLLQPTWASERPTPGGIWWVAGRYGDRPALAFLRDGAHWSSVNLPPEGDGITATLVGEEMFAFVLKGKNILRGYQVSTAGYQEVSSGGGMTISGEPIVLPDGRVLIADAESNWWVSADRGRTWAKVGGTMPVVGSLHQTRDGYVALDLFRAGWVATSADGVNWQKLPIR
jgi:RNA polymerase sigma factor (sigma-70 family)